MQVQSSGSTDYGLPYPHREAETTMRRRERVNKTTRKQRREKKSSKDSPAQLKDNIQNEGKLFYD